MSPAAASLALAGAPAPATCDERLVELANSFTRIKVTRRSGQVIDFDAEKISAAVAKAFAATRDEYDDEDVADVACRVLEALLRNDTPRFAVAIEDIQDQVELALVRADHHDVFSRYSKYRRERAEKRRARIAALVPQVHTMVDANGQVRPIDLAALRDRIAAASQGLSPLLDCDRLLKRIVASIHDRIKEADYERALVLETGTLIEEHPDYSKVAARLLLDCLAHETLGERVQHPWLADRYPAHLEELVARGVRGDRLDPRLQTRFDLPRLGAALRAERDLQFGILGLQTLYDRYFIKVDGKRIEMPQSMFMRVAMGLALEEDDPTARAIEFYEVLSSFRFMSSTPTLFNAGTTFPQLSSCYLSTVSDDLDAIFEAIKDNAMLAKFSGGLGNDWTPVRALGSYIKSTGGDSQGVVPFLRVVNDTAIAVNQGGKRKGAVCCYLETWHRDIIEFLDLRKNTGDDRRRTHDMNTANWIPDLFMERVAADGMWTLFSPSDVPDLHDKYGQDFKKAYITYEARAAKGEFRVDSIKARDLWIKMLRALYETGHPWITFKDPCNIRSPQQHAGVVHSSNLCTEITLNTKEDEIAVCNLGSVNLPRHLDDANELDRDLLADTVRTAMRMLDNVIDINYYSVKKAKNANMRHRPVGLGQAGFQDCLYRMDVPFDSEAAVEFADRTTELIAYHAYEASADLAAERGAYQTFAGSQWAQGIMPHDSLKLLARERNGGVDVEPDADGWLRCDGLEVHTGTTLDWDRLRAKCRQGMRNSNCLAIAPTATIGNIMGVMPCIEPAFNNIYVKENLSGAFKVVNDRLVEGLLAEDLWDDEMRSEIKANDGVLDTIKRIPAALKARYQTAFAIDQHRLIDAAARRQKWIDQAQSLNLYVSRHMNGDQVSGMYRHAWKRGLKTTYYCRTQQASSTEKYTTTSTGQLNAVAAGGGAAAACRIGRPGNEEECEACQ